MSASSQPNPEKKRCFVITAIGADQSAERRHANMVFEVALRPVFEEKLYSIERSDMSTDPGQITSAIFSALNEADVCVADLTFLNANAMYELCIRHALQKAVIQIAETSTSLPFDAANQRTIFFDRADVHSLQQLGREVRKQLEWIEDNPGKVSNPLTAALGVFANAAAADAQDLSLSSLVKRVSALEASQSSQIAAAIYGQGELATTNIEDLRRIWLDDQRASALLWNDEGADQVAQYRGFRMRIAPESKGRWSSSASEEGSNFSVPWPTWQSSAEDARRRGQI